MDQIKVSGFAWASNTNITNAIGTSVGSAAGSGITGTNGTNATSTIDNIDKALTTINSQRATFGAIQNRFENVIAVLSVSAENQTAARSRIMDADYAMETANLSRANILQQPAMRWWRRPTSCRSKFLSLLQR